MAPKTVDVLVPVALDRAYTYRVPAGLSLEPGDVVAYRCSDCLDRWDIELTEDDVV